MSYIENLETDKVYQIRDKESITVVETFNAIKTDKPRVGKVYFIKNFYTNDGVKGFYEIVNEKENVLCLPVNNVFAKLIPINGEVSIPQLGIKQNEYVDTIISDLLKICRTVYLNGKYCINILNNSNGIFLEKLANRSIRNGELYIKDNFSLESYSLIRLHECSTFELHSVTLDGSKGKNSSSTGEQGHCIKIYNSSKINLKYCNFKNGFGDGIEIGNQEDKPYTDINCKIEYCKIDGNSRNGISILDCGNIIIENCEIKNTKGKNPQYGIDIEPFYAAEKLKNIKITNCIFSGNYEGSILVFNQFSITDLNIKISNCILEMVNLSHKKGSSITALIENNKFVGNRNGACLRLDRVFNKSSVLAVNNLIDGITVINNRQGAPISIENPERTEIYGNYTLDFILNNVTNPNKYPVINIANTGGFINNCKIKINSELVSSIYKIVNSEIKNNVILKTSPTFYGYGNVYKLTENANLTGGNDFTGHDSLHFIIYNDSESLTLTCDTNFSVFNKQSITSKKRGSLIEYHIRDGVFIIDKMVGDWN